jgi:hypothetical protein
MENHPKSNLKIYGERNPAALLRGQQTKNAWKEDVYWIMRVHVDGMSRFHYIGPQEGKARTLQSKPISERRRNHESWN